VAEAEAEAEADDSMGEASDDDMRDDGACGGAFRRCRRWVGWL
jgi:hypothetical protein